jgi:BMFP domain-containing protein YqiC
VQPKEPVDRLFLPDGTYKEGFSMRFLDNLSKSISSGVDRAKFEAEKFQRTTKINGEIANHRSQIDTNLRQLGERALELFQQGSIHAPEIASLAQVIAQLREQVQGKEQELEQASAETFEQYQASQPQGGSSQGGGGQSVPISREQEEGGFPTPTAGGSDAYPPLSSDISGTGQPNSASIGTVEAAGSTPYACSNCGYSLPDGAVFCPNCGTRASR